MDIYLMDYKRKNKMKVDNEVFDAFGETCIIISINKDTNTAFVRYTFDDWTEEWDLDELTLIEK